jgi:hypothetical protein
MRRSWSTLSQHTDIKPVCEGTRYRAEMQFSVGGEICIKLGKEQCYKHVPKLVEGKHAVEWTRENLWKPS